MRKFIVVAFAREEDAPGAERRLRELHEQGGVSVIGSVLLVKDADGKVEARPMSGPGPRGAVAGAVLGGLVGLVGGPVVAAMGAAAGAMGGGWRDLLGLGVAESFVAEVSREMPKARSALVAEVIEEETSPLDAAMDAFGGVVLRERRHDAEDDVIRKEVEVRAAELAQLKSERATVASGATDRLDARIEGERGKLRGAIDRAKATAARVGEEAEEAISSCRDQAAGVAQDAAGKVHGRIAGLGAERDARLAKMRDVIQQAEAALA